MNVFLKTKFFDLTNIDEADVASAHTQYNVEPTFFVRQIELFVCKLYIWFPFNKF